MMKEISFLQDVLSIIIRLINTSEEGHNGD